MSFVTHPNIDPKSLGKVGVLLGGRSAEREISLMSGNGVLAALKSRGVDAHAFDPALQSVANLAAAKFDRQLIAVHEPRVLGRESLVTGQIDSEHAAQRQPGPVGSADH